MHTGVTTKLVLCSIALIFNPRWKEIDYCICEQLINCHG